MRPQGCQVCHPKALVRPTQTSTSGATHLI